MTLTARTPLRWIVLALVAFTAAAALLLTSGTAAFAASAPDTPGGDQEATDYYFGGVITFEEKPVPDVTVSVKGSGFDAETVTDAEAALARHRDRHAGFADRVHRGRQQRRRDGDAAGDPRGGVGFGRDDAGVPRQEQAVVIGQSDESERVVVLHVFSLRARRCAYAQV